MATEFKPVMYLKLNCPFCLKVAAFLEEAGVFGDFDVREFWPGDEREAAIRGELSPHVATISFPTVQVAPGEFLSESDSIIERFGHGFDPNIMPFYRYILGGPVRRLREQFAEIKELNEKLARIGS